MLFALICDNCITLKKQLFFTCKCFLNDKGKAQKGSDNLLFFSQEGKGEIHAALELIFIFAALDNRKMNGRVVWCSLSQREVD